jgi:archaeoflavoprotein AfpA
LKIAWGITGSGDYMPEIIKTMKEAIHDKDELKVYIFLSKAASQVIKWYRLKNDLSDISEKIFTEVDSNIAEPFYFLPGALQIGKFKFFIVCPATANTVAKIVRGIADTLITNAIAQAAKTNITIYIFPVDFQRGKQTTTLPTGDKMNLEMRKIDIANTEQLSRMKNIKVFTDPAKIKSIFNKNIIN